MLKSIVDGAGPGVETGDGEELRADLVLLAAGVMPDWFHKLGIQVNERPSNNHAVVLTRVSRVSRAVAPSSGSRHTVRWRSCRCPPAIAPSSYDVVWSMSDAQLSVVSQLDDAAFINEFQALLGGD